MKTWTGFILVIAVAALFLSSGCAEKEETTAGDVKREAKEAVDTAKKYTDEQRAKYVSEMKDKLESYDKDIEDLENQAREIKDETRVEMEQRVQDLRKKRDAMARSLEEMSSASGDAWAELKKGMDKAMDEISEAYGDAAAEFK
jgi:TolA-binding protein